jgi:hypothetical protein
MNAKVLRLPETANLHGSVLFAVPNNRGWVVCVATPDGFFFGALDAPSAPAKGDTVDFSVRGTRRRYHITAWKKTG